jgi:hypothetical protein
MTSKSSKTVLAQLRRRYGELAADQLQFADRVPRETREPATACIHVDDFSGIAMPPNDPLAHACFGSRAFARARTGDLVVGRCGDVGAYLDYLEHTLGLGRPHYLAVPERPGTNLFDAIIDDAKLLRTIGDWARERGTSVVLHPYMGHARAWRLAAALDEHCGDKVGVVAPPPALTAFVNDRLWFHELVRLVLGPESTLVSHAAASVKGIIDHMRALAESSATVAVHLSNSATGAGLVRFAAEATRHPDQLERQLEDWIAAVGWSSTSPAISVERWEPDVLASPSVQAWIPSPDEGPPILDGIFDQRFHAENPAVFVGSAPSRMPEPILASIATQSDTLCQVLQKLGYVGRCSFDTIVCGPDIERASVRFVECNGRWGGTSTPMALVNRVIGDHRARAWSARTLAVPESVNFGKLVGALADVLHERNSRRGWVILNNVACLEAVGFLDAITLGDSQAEADERQVMLGELIVARLG